MTYNRNCYPGPENWMQFSISLFIQIQIVNSGYLGLFPWTIVKLYHCSSSQVGKFNSWAYFCDVIVTSEKSVHIGTGIRKTSSMRVTSFVTWWRGWHIGSSPRYLLARFVNRTRSQTEVLSLQQFEFYSPSQVLVIRTKCSSINSTMRDTANLGNK